MFGVTDLYTAGLGAEIAGAVLLAKGLLLSPTELYARSMSAIEFNPRLVIGLSKDRADALFGVAGVCTGFALQLTGSIASLSVNSHARGAGAPLVVIGCVAAAAVLVVLPWWRLREPLVRREIIRVGLEAVPAVRSCSSATFLAAVAQTLGYGRRLTDGSVESDEVFARRVFGVEVVPSDPVEGLRHIARGYPSQTA